MERDTERKGDLAGAFTGGCICIQTSQHALLRYWGQNQPAAASQPWPFTTSPPGRVCTSRDSECIRVAVCLHVCEVKRDHTHARTCTHTGVCLWIQSSSLRCLSDLSSNRQLSNLLPHTSDSRLLYPPISLMLSANPSIFRTPSFPLNLPRLLQLVLRLQLPLLPSVRPSICIYSCRANNFRNSTEVERFQI